MTKHSNNQVSGSSKREVGEEEMHSNTVGKWDPADCLNGPSELGDRAHKVNTEDNAGAPAKPTFPDMTYSTP